MQRMNYPRGYKNPLERLIKKSTKTAQVRRNNAMGVEDYFNDKVKHVFTTNLNDSNDIIITSRLIEDIKKLISHHEYNFHKTLYFNVKELNKEILINNLLKFNLPIKQVEHNYYLICKDSLCVIRWIDFMDVDKLTCIIYAPTYEDIKIWEETINIALSQIIENKKLLVDIDWLFMTNSLEHFKFTEYLDDVVYNEAYPYIKSDIGTFVDQYISVDEPILLFIGPPGTGKTRFIRYILQKMALKVSPKKLTGMFTSDRQAVENANMYINFLSANYDFLVIEDMDYHLKKRGDGNFSMYNILSISDGLLKNNGKKKIILSTNLPNIKDIDDALTRPGRCFNIIHTRALDEIETKNLIKRVKGENIEISNINKGNTLSQIYKNYINI